MAVLLLKKGVAKQADPSVMKDFILHQWENELERHFITEETLLHPGQLYAPQLRTLYDRMKKEHDTIRNILYHLKSLPAATLQIRSFYELLEQNIRFEEREFFEQIQQTVTPSILALLGKKSEGLPVGSCDLYPVKFWE